MTLTDSDSTALGIVLEGTLYGAYIALFILYLVLWRHNHHVIDGPLVLAQIFLFSLCTVCLCFDALEAYFQILVKDMDMADQMNTGSLVIFTIIDYLAQTILLYRCWIIWGRRWVVVAVPGFLALVSLGGGFALAGLNNSPIWNTEPDKTSLIFISSTKLEEVLLLFVPLGIMTYSTSLVVNALTTLLIVAKIFLTSREACLVLGADSHQPFRIVTAMLIESGLLMFASQLILVVLFQRPGGALICSPITQIYGITPTLLNIRVAMGSAYDKTTVESLSLRFAHPGGATARSTGLNMSAIQSQDIDVELNNEGDAGDASQFK